MAGYGIIPAGLPTLLDELVEQIRRAVEESSFPSCPGCARLRASVEDVVARLRVCLAGDPIVKRTKDHGKVVLVSERLLSKVRQGSKGERLLKMHSYRDVAQRCAWTMEPARLTQEPVFAILQISSPNNCRQRMSSMQWHGASCPLPGLWPATPAQYT